MATTPYGIEDISQNDRIYRINDRLEKGMFDSTRNLDGELWRVGCAKFATRFLITEPCY